MLNQYSNINAMQVDTVTLLAFLCPYGSEFVFIDNDYVDVNDISDCNEGNSEDHTNLEELVQDKENEAELNGDQNSKNKDQDSLSELSSAAVVSIVQLIPLRSKTKRFLVKIRNQGKRSLMGPKHKGMKIKLEKKRNKKKPTKSYLVYIREVLANKKLEPKINDQPIRENKNRRVVATLLNRSRIVKKRNPFKIIKSLKKRCLLHFHIKNISTERYNPADKYLHAYPCKYLAIIKSLKQNYGMNNLVKKYQNYVEVYPEKEVSPTAYTDPYELSGIINRIGRRNSNDLENPPIQRQNLNDFGEYLKETEKFRKILTIYTTESCDVCGDKPAMCPNWNLIFKPVSRSLYNFAQNEPPVMLWNSNNSCEIDSNYLGLKPPILPSWINPYNIMNRN